LLIFVLQCEASPERPRVVAQVKRTGGSIAGEHDLSLWEATGFAQRELLRRWLVLLVPVCMLYRIVSHRVSSRTSSTRDVVSERNPCHRKIRRIA